MPKKAQTGELYRFYQSKDKAAAERVDTIFVNLTPYEAEVIGSQLLQSAITTRSQNGSLVSLPLTGRLIKI